jgi:sensor c-di-GMP phosphodiesterase-like protein
MLIKFQKELVDEYLSLSLSSIQSTRKQTTSQEVCERLRALETESAVVKNRHMFRHTHVFCTQRSRPQKQ